MKGLKAHVGLAKGKTFSMRRLGGLAASSGGRLPCAFCATENVEGPV